ncbi:MAG: hypothetical protein U1E29_11920 [Coriobacteriia bacterium]|nr:hypothetical protein [Coriobacteriia bacterium]
MGELRGDLEELRRRLDEGAIQQAYTAIIAYMSGLRGRFDTAHEEWTVAGLYQGYFDMTYFPLVVPSLKTRDLKLAIVFDYPSFGFQVWLAARNRVVQRRYWELLRDNGWPPVTLVEPAVGVDAIVVVDVADGLALVDQDALSASIESAAATLLGDLERFFDRYDPAAV